MSKMKDISLTLTGLAVGLTIGGQSAIAALTASPSSQTFYLDGQRISLTAYSIAGNNYVRLRDIGRAVDFGVTYDGGTNSVYIDPDEPYVDKAPDAAAGEIHIISCKGNTLAAGERSGLLIDPAGAGYAVISDDPAVADVENVQGQWTVVAGDAGSATITVTAPDGRTGRLALTVTEAPDKAYIPVTGTALTANLAIRQEIVRLANQVRAEAGVLPLTVNAALMDAAQDCSAQGFTNHDNRYECQSALAHGYPYGACTNLTVFTGVRPENIAEHAVANWVNSPPHFQTMIDKDADSIGAGVTVAGGTAYCYLFVGDSGSHNPYE